MSLNHYLNVEKLAQDIVESELAQMTDDNIHTYDDELSEIDAQKLTQNLQHGSIAAVFIAIMFEAALNTILSSRLHITKAETHRMRYDEKMQEIYQAYSKEITHLKTLGAYANVVAIFKLRNDLVHFKNSLLTESLVLDPKIGVPSGSSKGSIAEIFTKRHLTKCYRSALEVLDQICKECGLVLYTECNVIDWEGVDMACEFILDQEAYNLRERNL